MISIATGDGKSIAYEELNGKIERLCEWFYFALLGTLLSIVLFPLVYTGVAYYIFDLAVESFLLYPPTRYELKCTQE